jgi:thiamine transport system permease protein
LGVRPLRYFIFFPALILSVGWLSGFLQGVLQSWDPAVRAAFIPAVLTSMVIAIGVGLLSLLFFLSIAFVTPHRGLERFLNGYLSPSPVITGFALLLVPLEGDLCNILKIIVALTLISLPLLYRWLVHASLAALASQVRVATLLGAGWRMILFEVVWPQVAPAVLRASGLAAVWASGDFALSAILADDVMTLPLLMENLISNYRMEAAQVLMLPLLMVGGAVYFFFVQAGRYVAR